MITLILSLSFSLFHSALSGEALQSYNCFNNVKCIPSESNGIKTPYYNYSELYSVEFRSIIKVIDSTNAIIPQCSKSLQKFLNSIEKAYCQNNLATFPDEQDCLNIKKDCFYRHNIVKLPAILRNCSFFPSDCSLNSISTKYPSIEATQCPYGLVSTNYKYVFSEEFDHCSPKCNQIHHNQMDHFLLFWLSFGLAGVVTILNLLVIAGYFSIKRFVLPQKKFSLVIEAIYQAHFYMTFSSLSLLIGKISQLADNNIACYNNTLRQSEPHINSKNPALCIVSFLLLYFPLLSSLSWLLAFLSLTIVHIHQQAKKSPTSHHMTIKNYYDKFQIIIPTLSILLTFIVIANGSIDGDYINGVCFISSSIHKWIYLFMFYVPLTLLSLCISILIFVCMILLRINCKLPSPSNASKYFFFLFLWFTILGIIGIFIVTFHIYYEPIWKASLVRQILCKLYYQVNDSLDKLGAENYCSTLSAYNSKKFITNINSNETFSIDSYREMKPNFILSMVPSFILLIINAFLIVSLMPKRKLLQCLQLVMMRRTQTINIDENYSFWDAGLFTGYDRWYIDVNTHPYVKDGAVDNGNDNLRLPKRRPKHLSKLNRNLSREMNSLKSLVTTSESRRNKTARRSKDLVNLSHSNSLYGSRQSEKSYNSYQVMMQQFEGAEWREKWKTRMLIMDAVKWAENYSKNGDNSADEDCIQMTKGEVDNLKIFLTHVIKTSERRRKSQQQLNDSTTEILSIDERGYKEANLPSEDEVEGIYSKESNYFDSESETMSYVDGLTTCQLISEREDTNEDNDLQGGIRHPIGHILTHDQVKSNLVISKINQTPN